jgi:hypothetical protein
MRGEGAQARCGGACGDFQQIGMFIANYYIDTSNRIDIRAISYVSSTKSTGCEAWPADALKEVLGEDRVYQLLAFRSKNMIFSGKGW